MGHQAQLANIYMFKGLSDEELGKISQVATERNLSAGEEIFMTGDEATSFFLISMGSIKIYSNSSKGDAMGIANLGSGAHFGELPFFDEGKRSATAEAIEPCRMLEIQYLDLARIIEENPVIAGKIYKSCSRFLASRLRNTLDDLNQAREARLRHF